MSIIQRLHELDQLLENASKSASMARICSLNNGYWIHATKHKEFIDRFNATKFWFMKKRPYDFLEGHKNP